MYFRAVYFWSSFHRLHFPYQFTFCLRKLLVFELVAPLPYMSLFDYSIRFKEFPKRTRHNLWGLNKCTLHSKMGRKYLVNYWLPFNFYFSLNNLSIYDGLNQYDRNCVLTVHNYNSFVKVTLLRWRLPKYESG